MSKNSGAIVAPINDTSSQADIQILLGESIKPITPTERPRQVEEVASGRKQERKTEEVRSEVEIH